VQASLNGPQGRINLVSGLITVGRATDNEIRLDDHLVSSHHAEFRAEAQGYVLIDKGSTNGTFVNEQRLDRLVPRTLNPGDRIRFGNTTFIYEVSAAFDAQKTVPAPAPDQAAVPGYAGGQQPGYAGGPQPGYAGGPQPGYAGGPQSYPQQAPVQGAPGWSGPQAASPMQPGPGGYPGYQQPPRKRRRGGCILAMLVVLLLVVLAAVMVFLNPLHLYLPGPLAQLQLTSTPEKTLATFCNALQNGDYHTAYQQFSPSLQNQGTEADFSTLFEAARKQAGPMTVCSVSNVQQQGDRATGTVTMKWEKHPQTQSAHCDLVKINGVWKINRAVWLPIQG
jgi:hypothetical protein